MVQWRYEGSNLTRDKGKIFSAMFRLARFLLFYVFFFLHFFLMFFYFISWQSTVTTTQSHGHVIWSWDAIILCAYGISQSEAFLALGIQNTSLPQRERERERIHFLFFVCLLNRLEGGWSSKVGTRSRKPTSSHFHSISIGKHIHYIYIYNIFINKKAIMGSTSNYLWFNVQQIHEQAWVR